MVIKEISISSSIEAKISWAHACHKEFGKQLFEDEVSSDLLKKIKRAIHGSRIVMIKTGIFSLCEECEKDEGGSCCGAGVEDRYDGWLLLLNRLMGVAIPQKRRDPKSCFFLGGEGCLLYCRHVLCINYVCKKITDRIDPIKLNELREHEGEEIALMFSLNEHIKKVVRSRQEKNSRLGWRSEKNPQMGC